MGIGELYAGGNPAMDENPVQGGVEILQNKLRPNGPLGLYAEFTFYLKFFIVVFLQSIKNLFTLIKSKCIIFRGQRLLSTTVGLKIESQLFWVQ